MEGFITVGSGSKDAYGAVTGRSRAAKTERSGYSGRADAAARELGAEASRDYFEKDYELPEGFEKLSEDIRKEGAAFWMADGEVLPAGEEEDMLASADAEADSEDASELVGASDEEDMAAFFDDSGIEHMNSLLESMERARERQKAAREKEANTVKPLRYYYKRISTTIMKAKTVMQGSKAVQNAKRQLEELRRKGVSGQYDANEVQMAVDHASKMVRIARKKLANLKKEVLMDSDGRNDEVFVKRKKRYKDAHRRDENQDLLEADMKYLKEQLEYMKSKNANASASAQARSVSSAAQLNAAVKRESIKESLEEIIANGAMTDEAVAMANAQAMAAQASSGGGSALPTGAAVEAVSAASIASAGSVPTGGGFSAMA